MALLSKIRAQLGAMRGSRPYSSNRRIAPVDRQHDAGDESDFTVHIHGLALCWGADGGLLVRYCLFAQHNEPRKACRGRGHGQYEQCRSCFNDRPWTSPNMGAAACRSASTQPMTSQAAGSRYRLLLGVVRPAHFSRVLREQYGMTQNPSETRI